MTEETNSTENTEVTNEQPSEDTQQLDTQSDTQEETSTQQDVSLSDSMKIEADAEPENSEEASQPSIDDIVNEALTGELSKETQKLIDENDLGRHIDMLVEGHRAIQEKNNNEIFSLVGGEKSYSELQEWGRNNMSQEDQSAFNEALFSGNMNLAKLAVQGLKAQYTSQNGKEPSRVIEGGGSANEANRPFSSQMEYLKATQTLQYKQDPGYRKSIEQKRNLSGFY